MTDEEEPAPADGPWFDAWRGVLFASWRVLRVAERRLMEDVGIPLAWLDILARLHDAPGNRLRMQELQERALFTQSGITRLVDRIEAAGLVRREPAPGDRRGVYVVLTPEGERRHQEAFEAHLPVIRREFGERLTPDEQRAVAAALARFWQDDT